MYVWVFRFVSVVGAIIPSFEFYSLTTPSM